MLEKSYITKHPVFQSTMRCFVRKHIRRSYWTFSSSDSKKTTSGGYGQKTRWNYRTSVFFFLKKTNVFFGEAFSLWMFLVIATGPRNYPSLRPGWWKYPMGCGGAGRWLHRWQPTQCSESLEYGDVGGLCKLVVPHTQTIGVRRHPKWNVQFIIVYHI